MRPPRISFRVQTISAAIIDARAKAGRFRSQRLTTASEEMSDDCHALAVIFDHVADVLQERLAEQQGRDA